MIGDVPYVSAQRHKMNLQEFLSVSDVQLPLSWNETNDFQGFVHERLDRFCKLIPELDASPVADKVRSCEPAIAKCCDHIVRSVERSLNGYVHQAFEELGKAVQEVPDELKRQEARWDPDGRLLYRVRLTSSPRLQGEGLFHIPF